MMDSNDSTTTSQGSTLSETLLRQLSSHETKNTSTIYALKRSTESAAFSRTKANRKILRRVLTEDIKLCDQNFKKRKLKLEAQIEKEKRKLRKESRAFRKKRSKIERASNIKTEISNSVANAKTLLECARLQASWRGVKE